MQTFLWPCHLPPRLSSYFLYERNRTCQQPRPSFAWIFPSHRQYYFLNYRLMVYSRKNKQGGLRTTFFENTGIFSFLSYPWKFQTKQSSTLGNSAKLCYIPCKFQDHNQDPWRFHIIIF